MFTGIVEEKGVLEGISRSGAVWRIRLMGPLVCDGTRVGDSIAVDGVCLTVTEVLLPRFTVDVSGETRERTTISAWQAGRPVNLERALQLSSRLGGHIVQGHVDAPGKIISIEKTDDACDLCISFLRPWRRYLAAKGSVTVDGISLTVARLASESFSVAVIPHTFAQTTLADKKPGDGVNLEFDIIAKYTESLLCSAKTDADVLTADFLRERGF